jgi:hypothetical protein
MTSTSEAEKVFVIVIVSDQIFRAKLVTLVAELNKALIVGFTLTLQLFVISSVNQAVCHVKDCDCLVSSRENSEIIRNFI